MTIYTGVIWVNEQQGQQRFSIEAASRDAAIALLVETYGVGHDFTLVDEDAAKRIR